MTWNFKQEIGRKAIHLMSIFYLIIYFVFSSLYNHNIALLALTVLLLLFITFEYFRIERNTKVPLVSFFWRYKREKEKHKFGGEVFFLTGSILVLALFDIRIATAAILMTTFGDLVAAIIGKTFGKTYIIKNKSLEGTSAELITNIVIGLLIIRTGPFFKFAGTPIWSIIIIMALTATIVETLVNKLDDNLMIPLFSGFAGQMMLILLGI